MTADTQRQETCMRGLSLSPGTALGTARRVCALDLDVLARFAHDVDDVEREIARFRDALARSRDQIARLRDAAEGPLSAIVGAQVTMLEDEGLGAAVVTRIAESRLSSERIVAEQALEWAARFEALTDEAMRARAVDIQDVYHRVLRNLLEIEHVRQKPLSEMPPNTILVSERLLPSDILHLNLSHVDGIVTEHGSSVSHAAIVAQSLHIPFISEVAGVTALIRSGDRVLMDAGAGSVIVHPTAMSERRMRDARPGRSRAKQRRGRLRCKTRDGIRIDVFANASSAEDVEAAVAEGAAGIGLFRTEFFCITRSRMPDAETEAEFYRTVFEAAGKLPITFRLFDFGGDKTPAFLSAGEVSRTMLGNRGVRYLLEDERLLRRQVAALCRAAGGRRFDILVPFVTAEREMAEARRVIDEELAANGVPGSRCRVGMMLEVPSACFLLDRLLRHADFVSVGTNDLAQLTFAWEREESVDPLLSPEISGLMVRIIAEAVERTAAAGKHLTVCGEMAADPVVLPALIAAGARSLSVNIPALPRVCEAIRTGGVPEERAGGRSEGSPVATIIE